MLPEAHLPIAFLSFLDGLEPIQTLRKHRISAYFQFRAVLVAHLGCPPWSLAGALAPSCTLQRRCRWLCSAPSCSGTYVRAAQAAPTPRSKQTGGTLLQGAASCIPLGAPAQALPFPRHPKGLGRSPHWPTHPLFRNTDKRRMPSIIRASSLSTQRWAGGPHSVSLSTQ